VTKRLIEVESIDGEELKRLVEATLPGPRVVPGTDNAVARTTGTTAWDNSVRDSGTGTNGIANT
jgi:hypothetical protein